MYLYNVSVIIISYNTADLLKRAIISVMTSFNNFSYEIIVVDNASEDGSQDLIETVFPHVLIIKNATNRGFAKANNQAIEKAKGEYYLLLNSDAIIADSNFESIIKFLDDNKRVAAVGPKVLNTNGSLQSKGYSFPSIGHELAGLFRLPKFLKPSTLNRVLPRYYWDEDVARPVDWISGCCMLLRKETVDNIGGLSEDFFMYHEDEEWCYRAHQAGYQIWYRPAVSVIHDNNGSPMEKRVFAGRKSTKIYLKKTIGMWRGVVIQTISLFSNFVALFISVVIFNSIKTKICLNKIHLQTSFIRYLISTLDD